MERAAQGALGAVRARARPGGMPRPATVLGLALLAAGSSVPLAQAQVQTSWEARKAQIDQCRGGDSSACNAIEAGYTRSAGTPLSPQQTCLALLQPQLLDDIDCRRGHAASCVPMPLADAECRAEDRAQARALVGLDASTQLPGEPVLDSAYAHAHRARYPLAAFRDGVEGQTVLRVDVAADGTVSDVLVEASAGHRDLDRAAMESLRRQPFAPAMASGRAVLGRTRVTVPFVIGAQVMAPGVQPLAEPARSP